MGMLGAGFGFKYWRDESPVPGMPALPYFLPFASIPTLRPRGPALIPKPDLLKFSRTPGRIFMERRYRKPMSRILPTG
jgi:hypothetical protein